MYKKTGRKALSFVLVIILVLSMFIGGCKRDNPGDPQSPGDPQPPNENVQSAAELSVALQAKYGQDQTVNYAEGILEIARDHQFTVNIGFNPFDLGFEKFDEIVGLYYDVDLTQTAPTRYRFASDDKRTFTLSPYDFCMLGLYPIGRVEYPYGSKEGTAALFERGPNADWGNIGTMYLATWVDLETGKALDKPKVQIVTVRGELDTPDLTVEVTDDGLVQFSWKSIKGAKAYYIVRIDRFEDGKPNAANLIGHTTDTKWSSARTNNSITSESSYINEDFKTFSISEDDWLNPAFVERYKDEYDPRDGAVANQYDERRSFCVIAVNETGTSMFSRMIDITLVASIAPYSFAFQMDFFSAEGSIKYVKGVTAMPSHRWIVMCNGVLSQRLVNYDFNAAKAETQRWYYERDDGSEKYDAVDVDVLIVPYTLDGTALKGTVVVSEYDKGNYKNQLKMIETRQESLRSKTGNVRRSLTLEEETTQPSEGSTGDNITIGTTIVTANSALSEYLALSMLSGATVVDISGFPEALNREYLINAWAEAFYQNPLILGVAEAVISRDGKTLYLAYEDDQATRERKQDEIIKEVDRVVSQIITGNMSPLDKEFAINQYLCDTVTYDFAALENAEQYNYTRVDSRFYDSFTAYGALINGVGVCASYSAAFKLLADACGLECVVVTGYLNGSLGHAWNRVNLGDGQWATVDSTNNDIDFMTNALLNVPDRYVATTLVEDDRWVMNSALPQYANEDNSNEYYLVKGLFFDQEFVVDEIVQQLSTNKIAIIRTDYTLTDEQFYEIGMKVAMATGNTDLAGMYWMGVMVFATDPTLLM